MEVINKVILSINNVLSSYILVFLLLGAGIWFTCILKGVQLKDFKYGWRRTFGGLFHKSKDNPNEKGMSSFQALSTAIAAQVGTGNIAGAATAISVGGPGAIFWMWIAAFFGMSTIYAEALMAQKYRQVDKNGNVTGGPVYYIKAAFKNNLGKIMAGIFAVLAVLVFGFMGSIVQSNSIAASFSEAFNIPVLCTGIIIAVLAFLVFSGGMQRIAKVTETIVPIMALIYIVGSLVVIVFNINVLPKAFMSIIEGAFDPQAVMGGAFGATMKVALQKGIARGLFSNEAGMGSTPHAHAVAEVDHPAQQGQVAMVGVFLDTFVVLTLTALVILTTGVLKVDPATGSGTLTGVALAQAGFSSVFGEFGKAFIAICMFFFAFSTIIGWYFFGQANVKYLFGDKSIKIYTVLVCIFILIGSLGEVTLIWNAADCFNSLIVVPNILGLLMLSKVVVNIHKDYKRHRKEIDEE